MDIKTHQSINQELCGRPSLIAEGRCTIEMRASQPMLADARGLIHGGFIFGLADYAAMLAVNDPHVVLASAEVKFLKPVRLNDMLLAEAKVEEVKGKKQRVKVAIANGEATVFEGIFTCFVLDKHVLDD